MPFITQGKTNLQFISIVIVLGILAGGGILGYYYSWIAELDARLAELESRLPEVKSPEEVSPEEVPVDETISWKTYRNEQYGYEIKYPKDWIDTQHSYGVDVFELKTTNRQFDFFVAERGSQELNTLDNPECFKEIETAVFNQINWIINKELCTMGGTKTEISASTVKNENVFRVLLTSSSNLEKSIEELNQILSTFRFVEAKEPYIRVISPNGGEEWKIGTSHTISWEVNIPEDLKQKESWINIFLEKEGLLKSGRLNEFGVFTPRNSFIWDGSQYFIDTPEGGRTYHQVEPGDGYKIKLLFVWDPSPPQYKVKVKSVEDFSDETFSFVE